MFLAAKEILNFLPTTRLGPILCSHQPQCDKILVLGSDPLSREGFAFSPSISMLFSPSCPHLLAQSNPKQLKIPWSKSIRKQMKSTIVANRTRNLQRRFAPEHQFAVSYF